MINYRIFVLILLSLIIASVSAQEVFEINTDYPVQDVETHLQLMTDSDHSLTAERILKDTSLDFSLQGHLPKRLKIGEIYWGK